MLIAFISFHSAGATLAAIHGWYGTSLADGRFQTSTPTVTAGRLLPPGVPVATAPTPRPTQANACRLSTPHLAALPVKTAAMAKAPTASYLPMRATSNMSTQLLFKHRRTFPALLRLTST